jgi:hypothetical protein
MPILRSRAAIVSLRSNALFVPKATRRPAERQASTKSLAPGSAMSPRYSVPSRSKSTPP